MDLLGPSRDCVKRVPPNAAKVNNSFADHFGQAPLLGLSGPALFTPSLTM